jgi:hypothetical protein
MKLLEAALLFALTAILAPLLVDDLREILPWAAQRVLRRAARMLPSEHSERYAEEWTGELAAIPGRLPKLAWALQTALGAPAVNRELRGLPPLWLALLRRLSAIISAGLLLATGLLSRLSQRPRASSVQLFEDWPKTTDETKADELQVTFYEHHVIPPSETGKLHYHYEGSYGQYTAPCRGTDCPPRTRLPRNPYPPSATYPDSRRRDANVNSA